MDVSAIKRDIMIGPCRMILGDCIEVLPQLEEKADMAATDPPYLIGSGGGGTEVMGGIFSHAEYNNSGELMEIVPWDQMGGPIYRALKDDAEIYVMANDKNIFAAHGGFTGSGFKFHNLLTWDKVRATRNRWFMKNLEFTLFLWKGSASVINAPGSKQLFLYTENAPRNTGHPTEKPVELLVHYIKNSSNQGDLVLDPFSGSGTTMVACIKTGRRGIGIEKNLEYYEAACERVRQEFATSQNTSNTGN